MNNRKKLKPKKVTKIKEKYFGVAAKARPGESFFGRIRRKKSDLYTIYPDVIYARNYVLADTDSVLKSNFSYYFIHLRIGAGSDTGENINRVQFELEFQSSSSAPRIDIIDIVPRERNLQQGKQTKNEIVTFEKKGEAGGGADAGVAFGILNANFNASGSVKYDKKTEIIKSFEFPKTVNVAQGRGSGTNAIWEFTQADIEPFKGQYDLEIYFRIRKPHLDVTRKGSYKVIPTIIVNSKRLQKDESGKKLQPIEMEFLA